MTSERMSEKIVLKLVKRGINLIRPAFREAGREIELISVNDWSVTVRITPPILWL